MDMTAGGARAASETDGSGDPGSDSWAIVEGTRIQTDAIVTAVNRRANEVSSWRWGMTMERGDSTLQTAPEATFEGQEKQP